MHAARAAGEFKERAHVQSHVTELRKRRAPKAACLSIVMIDLATQVARVKAVTMKRVEIIR